MTTEQAQTYRERSRVFLAKARKELDAGDLEQASEKAWDAAALMVKAIAEQRGMEHTTHNNLFGVLRVATSGGAAAPVADRLGVRRMFGVANELHHNFYEHRLSAEEVGEDIATVEEFVAKMVALLDV